MGNIVKIVKAHSRNKKAIKPIDAGGLKEPSAFTILRSLVWKKYDNPDDVRVVLSAAYEWHICADDGGFITLKAYKKKDEIYG